MGMLLPPPALEPHPGSSHNGRHGRPSLRAHALLARRVLVGLSADGCKVVMSLLPVWR